METSGRMLEEGSEYGVLTAPFLHARAHAAGHAPVHKYVSFAPFAHIVWSASPLFVSRLRHSFDVIMGRTMMGSNVGPRLREFSLLTCTCSRNFGCFP